MNQTPQEALDLLDRAVSMLQANRADHVALQQAIMVLRRAVSDTHTRPVAVPPPVSEPEAANGG